MQQREGEFNGERGMRIYWRTWRPETARAIVVLVHGLGEHSGRYEHVAAYLVEHGFAVYALDLRGHGRSDGPRGHVERFADYVADVGRLVELARAETPGVPAFIYGHSLGGPMALLYAQEHAADLRGVIASAPALRRAFAVPAVKTLLGTALSRLLPAFSMATGLPPDQLSHDPQVTAAYRADPLVHDRATVRLFTEATAAGEGVLARAEELRVPCLVLQGSDDAVVDPMTNKEYCTRLGSPDKRLCFYEGYYHETHNEVGKERVLDDIVTWLDEHSA